MERAVVRIWKGRVGSDSSAVYLGTGFLIDPGFVLTSKHVILMCDDELYPTNQIFLQSDTGAWPEGGIRCISDPIVADDFVDIALLPLKKPILDACCLSLAEPTFELESNMEVQLMGYSTPSESIEKPQVKISAYAGSYDLEVIHTFIKPGFSGGPVLYNGKLVAVIRLRDIDANKTYLIRVNSFRQFLNKHIGIQYQPITTDELNKLQLLIADCKISYEQVDSIFHKIQPDSRYHEANDIGGIITFYAQKQHKSTRAPLVEFVEYILEFASQSTQVKLKDWQSRLAKKLSIDLISIRNPTPISSEKAINPTVILVKIEPENMISTERFEISAWCLFQGNSDGQEFSPKMCHREQLADEIQILIHKLINQHSRYALPRLEFLLPLCLFDWNPNEIRVPLGPPSLSIGLGKYCPTVTRSWQRIYDPDYSCSAYCWPEKWENLPKLNPQHVHCINDLSVDCYLNLLALLKEQSWVFLMLCLLPENNDHRANIMGTALAAGLPFIFWPLSSECDIENLYQDLDKSLFGHDQSLWPSKLHEQRKTQTNWNHLAMLWDDPTLLPPDADDAHLQAPTE